MHPLIIWDNPGAFNYTSCVFINRNGIAQMPTHHQKVRSITAQLGFFLGRYITGANLMCLFIYRYGISQVQVCQ